MRAIVLVAVVLVALFAAFLTINVSGDGAALKPKTALTSASSSSNVSAVDVLVARVPIAVGTVIDETMIDKQPWPSHLVLSGFVVGGSANSDVKGMVARASFQEREPLILSKLAKPNDPSFLAATLPKGTRAITIATDAVSGVAGYIFPGDRVDVLVTHNMLRELSEDAKGSGGKAGVTEVLVPNVRVLAVNLRQPPGAKESIVPAAVAPNSVSMEVSQQDAQRIRLAERNGTLSLALRSLQDHNEQELPPPTLVNGLSQASVPAAAAGDTVRIVRGIRMQSVESTAERKPGMVMTLGADPGAAASSGAGNSQ